MLKVFAIYDSKIEAFQAPFYARRVGEAERFLTDSVNDPNTSYSKYPEDFTLFELGSFDVLTGKFTVLDAPHSISNLVVFKKASLVSEKH